MQRLLELAGKQSERVQVAFNAAILSILNIGYLNGTPTQMTRELRQNNASVFCPNFFVVPQQLICMSLLIM